MQTAVVTTKGQVVIPAKIRRQLGIKQGTRLGFGVKRDHTIVIRPVTEAFIDSMQGILAGKPGEKPVTQELVEEHADEVAREERDLEKRGF